MNSVEYYSKSELHVILKKCGVGICLDDDPFFYEGNLLIKPFVKLGILSHGDEDEFHEINMVVCNVPGCGAEFETIFSYESHYNLSHRFTCNECKKNLPNSHLLDLHISESHDSYFAVLAEKQPMFSCYLEECDIKSINASVRRDHCITLHKFPPNFRFDKPLATKHKQKPICIQKKSTGGTEMEVDCNQSETENFKHINFGHQRIPGFYQEPKLKKKKNPSILDTNDMVVDLIESLPT